MKVGGKLGCHQRADRSFFFRGYQFPVCARCTGVLVGEVLGIVIQCIFSYSAWVNVLLCVPMAFDWGIQRLGVRESTKASRVITGCLGGIGLISLQITLIKEFILFGCMLCGKG